MESKRLFVENQPTSRPSLCPNEVSGVCSDGHVICGYGGSIMGYLDGGGWPDSSQSQGQGLRKSAVFKSNNDPNAIRTTRDVAGGSKPYSQ